MLVKEWLEKFNYAPYTEEEIAETCVSIEDSDLSVKALAFLDALDELRGALEDAGFEFG